MKDGLWLLSGDRVVFDNFHDWLEIDYVTWFNCIICKYGNFSYVWMVVERCIFGTAYENSICTKYVTELK